MTTRTLTPKGNPALLVEVSGQAGVSRFVGPFVIGRAPDCDLAVVDASVSQRHAEVVFEKGCWWLRDLDSTNGTVVGGRKIDAVAVLSPLRVRLGYSGPAIFLTPEGAGAESAGGDTLVPTESAVARRYLARRPPTDMGEMTALLRRVLTRVQRQRLKKSLVALAVLGALGLAAAGYAYYLHITLQRQLAAATELFYAAKDLELEIEQLELSAAQRLSYRARREELDRLYQDYVEELGIYSADTPEDVRLIYEVAHRFGESELNIPPDFVDEVRRYIDRWKTTPRLEQAIARARANGYVQRIVEIMLEHGMPPEFLYLALQESDFRLEAAGPPTRFGIAKGMWQLIPGTARQYGLRTGPLVGTRRHDSLDERHDFEKSTRAAARYLRRIYNTDAQASGLLVIASYNWGQTRMLRLIRSLPESPRQRNFWQILSRFRDQIPRETYDYVFSIVSAAVIGENPGLFGFDFDPPIARPADASSHRVGRGLAVARGEGQQEHDGGV